jgi:hypothetical protein
LQEELAAGIEDEDMHRAVRELLRMHDRSRRLTDDPVLCIDDIEDFFSHVAFPDLLSP